MEALQLHAVHKNTLFYTTIHVRICIRYYKSHSHTVLSTPDYAYHIYRKYTGSPHVRDTGNSL